MAALFIVDPQIDFCDITPTSIGGWQPRLAIPDSDNRITKLANFVRTNKDDISHIYVTLDSHQTMDIAHTVFWHLQDGSTPNPFTQIDSEDLASQKIVPTLAEHIPIAKKYLADLGGRNKYTHTLWPEHAIIGTIGHTIHPSLSQAIREWELFHKKNCTVAMKGTHQFTEHFSVFSAEVPNPSAPETELNIPLLQQIASHPVLFASGLASSHCLKASMEDLIDYCKSYPTTIAECTLFTDTTCPVPGFEHLEQPFFDTVTDYGWSLGKTSAV